MVLTLCSYLLLRLVCVSPLAPYVAVFPVAVASRGRPLQRCCRCSAYLLFLPGLGVLVSSMKARYFPFPSEPQRTHRPAVGQCLRLFLLAVKVFPQFSSSDHLRVTRTCT